MPHEWLLNESDMTVKEAMTELRLAPGFDAEAVKQAYRARARETHPDHGGSNLAFGEVKQAADVLLKSFDKPRAGRMGRGRINKKWGKGGNDWKDKVLCEVLWQLRMYDDTEKACKIVEGMRKC